MTDSGSRHRLSPLNPAQAALTRMSTPSLSPSLSNSSGTSPSKVAKSPLLFKAWADRANIVPLTAVPPSEITDHFDRLYEVKELPSILVQGYLPTPIFDYEADFQRIICAWASKFSRVEGDLYGIIGVLPTLALAYSCVRKTSNNTTKEYGQRRAMDEIINIAFSAKIDRHCDFRTEESYRLLALNDNPDGQSDTLVTVPSPTIYDIINDHRLSFADPTIMDNLFWSTKGYLDAGVFSIIGFAAEFKKDDADSNRNQLTMVLATAQSHRKALGLNKSIIMGATGCRGKVEIYSSYWKSDYSRLYIYEHKQQFDLSDPAQVLHLYIFYSKLEKHLKDTLTLELEAWTVPDEISIKITQWRSSNKVTGRKRRRSEAGGSVGGSNGSGGNNNVPVEADGFDNNDGPVDSDADGFDNCHWFTKVSKWRDESPRMGQELWPFTA